MQIDFSVARTLHLLWRGKLRDFLDGRHVMTLAQAVAPHECDLGRWLHAVGLPAYGHLREVQRVCSVHAEMHTAVRGVLELRLEGDAEGAESEYLRVLALSDELMKLLNDLDRRMKLHAA